MEHSAPPARLIETIKMERYFSGKVALVTGAASGIGHATALLYAQHGARVIVSDINEDGGGDTVSKIKERGGDATFVNADVSDPEACQELVRKAVETYGRIDVACNNAGVVSELNKIADLDVEEWHKVIETNLNGVFYCLKYQIRAMLLQGGGGSIVNTASVLGTVGFASSSAYVAAKHGVVGLTKTAALEYSDTGIRINAVAPGFIDTPLFDGIHPKARKMLERMQPTGRLGRPEEVAELIIWLSSDKATFANGGYYPVDGAYLAR